MITQPVGEIGARFDQPRPLGLRRGQSSRVGPGLGSGSRGRLRRSGSRGRLRRSGSRGRLRRSGSRGRLRGYTRPPTRGDRPDSRTDHKGRHRDKNRRYRGHAVRRDRDHAMRRDRDHAMRRDRRRRTCCQCGHRDEDRHHRAITTGQPVSAKWSIADS